MSYVLHIWEDPKPSSVAEADQILSQLSEQIGPQNLKFIKLAKQLTKRHPCISELDDDDPLAVWADGPLDGETPHPVYGLGVQTSHLDSVVPFVVETAKALGLTVYDMQAAEVHLPSQTVLTMPGRDPVQFAQAAQEPQEQLSSAGEAYQILYEGLRELMQTHGYKYIKKEKFFVKKFPDFQHEIYIFTQGKYLEFSCEIRVRIKLVAGIDFIENTLGYKFNTYSLMGSIPNFNHQSLPFEYPEKLEYGKFFVRTNSQIQAIFEMASQYFQACVFPILDQCNSLQGFNRYANTPPYDDCPFGTWRVENGTPIGGGGSFVTHLVLAYLAKSPNIREMAHYFRSLCDQYPGGEYDIHYVEKTLPYILKDENPATP